MKLKRFLAPDMRQALRMVREEQGPDAVILSNQRIDGGVEIIAAVDYDPVLARRVLAGSGHADAGEQVSRIEEASVAPAQQHAGPVVGNIDTEPPHMPPVAPLEPAIAPARGVSDGAGIGDLHREVAQLRQLLECQLASMAWGDLAQRDPFTTSVLRRLGQIGLDPEIAMSIAIEMGPRADAKHQARELIAKLDARLPVVDEEIIDEGGVVALVGPTGVGKTTTVAKLAARFALKHGRRRLALVSLDNFRIGAHEQLLTFGRILGVPVHFTGDADGLRRYLDQLADKALVLVDTAGVGQRDQRLREQLAPLAELGEDVRVLLTLAANTQRQTLQEIVERFACLTPSAIVLTKLDEAVSLGAALSLLMRHGVPLAYATDGQRVPEDIHFARSKRLALTARALALQQPAADGADERTVTREVLSCA